MPVSLLDTDGFMTIDYDNDTLYVLFNDSKNHSDYKPEQLDECDISDIMRCYDWAVNYLDLSDVMKLFENLFLNFDMKYKLGPIAESTIILKGLSGEWIIKSG